MLPNYLPLIGNSRNKLTVRAGVGGPGGAVGRGSKCSSYERTRSCGRARRKPLNVVGLDSNGCVCPV